MKLQHAILLLVTAAGAVASWLHNPAYKKWHDTELDRWLSDHDIPHITPSDRDELEHLVAKHWETYVVHPYMNWDTEKLRDYITSTGGEVAEGANEAKDTLVSRVKGAWYETEDKAQEAWSSVKDWLFDTWGDSHLKAFCDKMGIPVPQPRTRDTMLKSIRTNYEDVARKAGETAAYPGNWVYESWSNSDLKSWLDKHGFPVPQGSSRNQLIAAVRRNSRLAYLKQQEVTQTVQDSVQSAFASLTDKAIDTWSESQLKEFCDENGIKVPQGTRANELRALVRKHRAQYLGHDMAGKVGAATSSAGNQFSKATDSASLMIQEAFNSATETWSQSRLKSYLDARGIPVPQNSNLDELRALVRKNAHSASGGWTFDDWSYDNLKKYLLTYGDASAKKVANKRKATRDDLVNAAQSAYASASSAGGSTFASATSYISAATQTAKAGAFDTWSESDLKSYLESYGVPVPHHSKIDELRAEARKQWTYYQYGTSTPSGTILAKIGEQFRFGWDWVARKVGGAAGTVQHGAEQARPEL